MSVIFGIRKRVGIEVTRAEMESLARATARWSFGGYMEHVSGSLGTAIQPRYTHPRSAVGTAFACDPYGNVLSLDGRLDSHEAVEDSLELRGRELSDAAIMLAAFVRWGSDCFAKFVGDWAVALWSAQDRTVYLARDHAGTRTLYYANVNGTIIWSTHLETFFAAGNSERLNREYLLRYLGSQPLLELTPYNNIKAVPPAHWVALSSGPMAIGAHWESMSRRQIRYQSDEEYSRHFLSLLERAVARRTEGYVPMVAELSGGMDSSSIVCVSDRLRRGGPSESELLDTISYYDDSEPAWNETPYFTAVEEQRGKRGLHIPISSVKRSFDSGSATLARYLLPGADASAVARENLLLNAFRSHEYGVIISGIGGDETLGGVPTGLPALADYLWSGNLHQLLESAINWCLATEEPLGHMLYQVARFVVRLYSASEPSFTPIPPWLRTSPSPLSLALTWARRHDVGSITPGAISSGTIWWSLVETLPHLYPEFLVRREYRYPLLDRDLIEYVFSVPQGQLVRPGRRRFMMRNALKGIIPDAVLERRRKAYVSRQPILDIQAAHSSGLGGHSIAADLGLIDFDKYRESFELVSRGRDTTWIHAIRRTLDLELWLHAHFHHSGLIDCDDAVPRIRSNVSGPQQLRPDRAAS